MINMGVQLPSGIIEVKNITWQKTIDKVVYFKKIEKERSLCTDGDRIRIEHFFSVLGG